MLCQACGALNSAERELCSRCGTKLMILSGAQDTESEASDEFFIQAQEELEENILERLTGLEDSVRRLSKAVAATARNLGQLEHNLTVAHAGVQSLGGLLESQGIVTRSEVVDGWELIAGQELLSRDLSRRFRSYGDRILSQATHSGHASEEFRRKLRALELALVGPETGAVRDLLTDLVRMAPSSDELWSFIGEAAFQTGELETARIAFLKVLELRGPHYEALVYLGAAASDLGRWTEAEAALKRAHELAPESFLPHFTLGALNVLRGRHKAAVRHLERGLALDDSAAQGWYLLGYSRLELGHGGRAIDALERAVELSPDFEDALYHLGVAYLRRGWSRKALASFEQVLGLDPQRLQYQETVRLLSGQPPEDLPPPAKRLVEAAESALDDGRPERALDLFTDALHKAPDEPILRAAAALLASISGRPRDAIAHAHALLRRRPQASPYGAAAVVALLESLRQAGRPLAARRLARSLYEREPDDPFAQAMVAYELAIVESEIGSDLLAARDLARESLEIAPKELRHYPLAALGAIALKRGRYREASQYFEQAARSSNRPKMQRSLALAGQGPDGLPAAALDVSGDAATPGAGLDHELLAHLRHLAGLRIDLARSQRPLRSQTHR
ncbi:MAG TPA: tetratricopeptide repeat protein [Chondromyces sp.]|nr:tetratricopeptide repeat protein [Chondromyces sp.]